MKYDYLIIWTEQYSSRERQQLCESFSEMIREVGFITKCYEKPEIHVYELKDIYSNGVVSIH